MPKTKQQDTKEVYRSIASGLRTASVRPNILGYRPYEAQKKFHSSTAPGRLFLGGNRSGKTVGGAAEMVWWLQGKHPYLNTPPPPVRARAIGVDFINGIDKIVKPEISRWVPLSWLKGGSWYSAYDKEHKTLEFENGSFLEFMSYDQDLDAFAGTSRHAIWFDEEPPHSIFVENKMRLLDVGGHWWMTMTPVEGMTWIYDDLYLASRVDPNIFVVEVDMTENIYLNQTEIESFLSGLSDDERKARVQGKFVQRAGLIYNKFSPKNIIDPIVIPESWLHVASMDHGFNNPTAWLWAAINSDGDIVVYDEHYESGQVVSYHAERVKEMERIHGQASQYFVGDPSIRNTDPITGTSVHLEYIEHGVPIILGNNDVKAGINRVAKKIIGKLGKPELYITRNCVNLIYEIQRYRWATWATKKHEFEKNKKEEPHKKDDHACDALRYLVASRPEVDNGLVVPKFTGPLGASVAIDDPAALTHNVLEGKKRKKEYVDFTLGEEY